MSVREPLLSGGDGVLMLSPAAVPLALALRKMKLGGAAPTGLSAEVLAQESCRLAPRCTVRRFVIFKTVAEVLDRAIARSAHRGTLLAPSR